MAWDEIYGRKQLKLFLDDVRDKPVQYDIAVKTVHEAKAYIITGKVVAISFDHDLGTEETGYDLAKFIEEQAYHGNIKRISWNIHSANPVGAANIRAAMKNADKYWDKHEENP